jgi:hypothetical protein
MKREAIVLVACAATKLPKAAPAQDLYISDLFRKARRWAERHGARWYILSALHGLVEPSTVLEPYNQTLNTMAAAERRVWAQRVAGALPAVVTPQETHLIFLAGDKYRSTLGALAEQLGYSIEAPLAGFPIGKQLAWYSEQERR